MINQLYDRLTGPCVRRIKSSSSVYLTFDDGPDPVLTPKVLSLLKKHQAHATFFVIANKASEHLHLVRRMMDEGHAIGDHSLDHDTKNYFKSQRGIKDWLLKSDALFKNLHIPVVGFRSPLGMKTPPLNRVLKELNQPLLLWSVRFYDTAIGLGPETVARKLNQIDGGSIILLHDTHAEDRHDSFLRALEFLLVEGHRKGLSFSALSQELVSKSK